MNKKTELSVRPDADVYKQSVAYIVENFTTYLLESADEGYLPGITPTVIKALSKSFADDYGPHLEHYLDESINAHLQWKERDMCSKLRQRPFDRLLVKRFSKWFPKHGDLVATDVEHFSRRMLPGLLKALAMMAGNDQQRVAEAAISVYWKQIMAEKGDLVDWHDLYKHREANEAVDVYLAHIALSFKDFDDRLHWFIRAINNGLGQPEKYAFEGEGVWVWMISEEGALKLLRTLYSPISRRVHDDRKRDAFEHGLEQRCIQHTYHLLDELAARH